MTDERTDSMTARTQGWDAATITAGAAPALTAHALRVRVAAQDATRPLRRDELLDRALLHARRTAAEA